MKPEEAISVIKNSMIIKSRSNGKTIIKDALGSAIEALEKQVAKKPIIENYSPAKCPSCGKEMSQDLGDGYYQHHDALKVCDCGQKLDWEVQDE